MELPVQFFSALQTYCSRCISWIAVVRQQIDSNTTGCWKKNWTGNVDQFGREQKTIQCFLHSFSFPDDGNQALQEFLHSLNPRQQHSTALESYLIKPIQRILKYPLLLQQLKNLTVQGSDEQQHLVEALIGMQYPAQFCFDHPVVLLSYSSQFGVVRWQIDCNTTGWQKKNLVGYRVKEVNWKCKCK